MKNHNVKIMLKKLYEYPMMLWKWIKKYAKIVKHNNNLLRKIIGKGIVMEDKKPIDVFYDMDIAQICQHFSKSRNTVDKAIAKLVKDNPDKDWKYKNPETRRGSPGRSAWAGCPARKIRCRWCRRCGNCWGSLQALWKKRSWTG